MVLRLSAEATAGDPRPFQGGELDQLQMMTMRVPRNQPTALLLQP
ncbi:MULTISPECIES: hypothetical protein [Prochlorococcus]|nr:MULTISPECIES: hypothetical protein [Prochlorococcus]